LSYVTWKRCKLFGWNKYKTYSISLSPLKQLWTHLSISTHLEKQKAKNRVYDASKTILHESNCFKKYSSFNLLVCFMLFDNKNTFLEAQPNTIWVHILIRLCHPNLAFLAMFTCWYYLSSQVPWKSPSSQIYLALQLQVFPYKFVTSKGV
jgi:hypothetical protein